MKTVGIICEFNPFHNGHAYIIGELRKRGADRIVCVMSGNFVQRGEPALMPSFYRAEAALKCGADLCVGLPFPWSCSSAAYFARAGMAVLKNLGADAVGFGSECGDEDRLRELGRRCLPARGNGGSEGIAGAYFGEQVGPNDILASEYIKQAEKISWFPEFIPVKRIGCGHDSDMARGEYLSASSIRRAVYAGEKTYGMPAASADMLEKAVRDGLCPADTGESERITVAYLRIADPESVNRCAECSGGVGDRLVSAAKHCDGWNAFASLCATKKYTDARLRRAALFALAGVLNEDLSAAPSYVRLLAANGEGRRILYGCKGSDIRVVTKEREIPEGLSAARQHLLEERSDGLYGMLFEKRRDSGFFRKIRPFIL